MFRFGEIMDKTKVLNLNPVVLAFVGDAVYSLYVPLKDQKEKYQVVSSVTLLNDTIYMPCGRNVYLHVK